MLLQKILYFLCSISIAQATSVEDVCFLYPQYSYVRNTNWQDECRHTHIKNRVKEIIVIYEELIVSAENLPNNFQEFCQYLKKYYDFKNPSLTQVQYYSFQQDLARLGITQTEYEEDLEIHLKYIDEYNEFERSMSLLPDIIEISSDDEPED